MTCGMKFCDREFETFHSKASIFQYVLWIDVLMHGCLFFFWLKISSSMNAHAKAVIARAEGPRG